MAIGFKALKLSDMAKSKNLFYNRLFKFFRGKPPSQGSIIRPFFFPTKLICRNCVQSSN